MDYNYMINMFNCNHQEYSWGDCGQYKYIHVCNTTYKFTRKGEFIKIYHNI
ncbi:TPA: hypothetical protein LA742_001257 [Clostridium botulinum]|uniref:hypothetical protein n=1 Tax=Clostridium sporogenes TaxID=1509 RepID=UPI000B1E161F|nr:hypothetical protein [Clostridium sporogenes]HBJ2612823.1 hypothetical protein [Clostridium botulinum]